jgi:hypothetical protein
MLGPRRNVSELLLAFIAFEEREQLFERSLLGVAYWQLIRHDVFRETIESLGLAARAHLRVEELPLRHWLGAQLRHMPKTLERSRLRHTPAADLLIAAHPRHVPYQGKFICPYSQPLLWGTARSRVVLEGHFQGRYFAPDAGESTRYVDLALVRAHAEFRLRELRGAGLTARDAAEIAGLVQRMRDTLGGAPETAAVLRRVRTALLAALGLTPWLERLLEAVRPKLVVVVVGYRLVNQLLTQVARSRAIAVAELQHGTLGASHAGYNFAAGRRPASFPDHLLLFGEFWRQATPGLPLPASHTPAIGYGWLDLQRASYERTERAVPRRVLFLSQRGIGRELAKVASALRTRLPGGEFEIVYRLHPSEGIGWQSAYPELARSDIRVERAEERALYASQSAAHVQVGVYSTALLEGMAFGLETFLVELPGHEQLAMLSAAGLARTVGDAETLAQWLQQSGTPHSAPSAAETLWTPGAAANFARFVEQNIG